MDILPLISYSILENGEGEDVENGGYNGESDNGSGLPEHVEDVPDVEDGQGKNINSYMCLNLN